MEKSEKCLKQCHNRTKVSNPKIISDNSILRMPRVKDGKSIARAKLCATLECPKTTKNIHLTFIIVILAFANFLNLALGSYANDVNGDVPPLAALNIIQSHTYNSSSNRRTSGDGFLNISTTSISISS